MARGRMISQTVATDKRLNSISEEAELVFLKTVPHLDRDGIVIGDPVLLTAQVCPRRPKLGAIMAEIIQEWVDAGLVIRYDTDEDPLLFFPGFSKNQVGLRYDREPASTFPAPPGYYRNGNGLEPIPDEPATPPPTSGNIPPTSGNLPANIRQSSGTLPPEVKEKLKENKTTTARETIRTESESSGGGGFSETPQVLNRQTDPEYAQVCRAIEDNGFGFMTPMLAEEVGELLKEYPLQWILDAMRIAVDANKRTMRYAAGVLRKWRADGRDPTMPGASPPLQSKPEVYVMPAAARALVDRLKSLSPQ